MYYSRRAMMEDRNYYNDSRVIEQHANIDRELGCMHHVNGVYPEVDSDMLEDVEIYLCKNESGWYVKDSDEDDKDMVLDFGDVSAVSQFIKDNIESLRVHRKNMLCPSCDGEGTEIDPKYDAGGFTHDDYCEDPDWYDEYYFSGRCDRPCSTCKGEKVIKAPDYSFLKHGVKSSLKVVFWEAWRGFIDEYIEMRYDMAREWAHERAMGY